jgi:cytochrome c-type biogenesis protein CcmH/NrfF
MKKVLWLFPVAALVVSTVALWMNKKKGSVKQNYLGI